MPAVLNNLAFRLAALILAVWSPIFILLFMEPQLELATGIRVSGKTAAINMMGVASVLAGIALSRFTLPRRRNFRPLKTWSMRKDLVAVSLMLMASFIGAYLTVTTWREFGVDLTNVTGRTLYEMNVIYSQQEKVITGLSGRLTAVSFVGAMYCLYMLREKRLTLKAGIILVLLFLAAMISPRRALLITALVSLLAMWLLSTERIGVARLLKFIPYLLAILAFFGFTQLILQKSNEFSIIGSILILLDYYISSFYVMDRIIDSPHFENTFILLSVPERISSVVFGYRANVDLSVPFVFVPRPANTVPAFYYFYKSGGYLAVFAVSLFIGWCLMRLYANWRLRPSFFSLFALSLFTTGIILSPRQCLFIEYDFVFFLAMGLILDKIRQQRGTNSVGPRVRARSALMEN